MGKCLQPHRELILFQCKYFRFGCTHIDCNITINVITLGILIVKSPGALRALKKAVKGKNFKYTTFVWMNELENRLLQKQINPTAMRLLVLDFLEKQSTAVSLTDMELAMDPLDRVTLFRTVKT